MDPVQGLAHDVDGALAVFGLNRGFCSGDEHMRSGFGLGDAELGADLRQRFIEKVLVVFADVVRAVQAALDGAGKEFGCLRLGEGVLDGLDIGKGQHADFKK